MIRARISMATVEDESISQSILVWWKEHLLKGISDQVKRDKKIKSGLGSSLTLLIT